MSLFRCTIHYLDARCGHYYQFFSINPLSANFAKWPNTLKQFVGNLPTNYLNVFGHFVGLALKGLRKLFFRNKRKTKKLWMVVFLFQQIIRLIHKSPLIRQKGESQNEFYRKTQHAKVSEKRIVRIRGWEMFVFLKIWGVFCFLVTPALRSSFYLITDELLIRF